MRIGKIGHAGIVVSAGNITCVMDPVVIDPFECGTNTMNPPVQVDVRGLAKACNLLVLSHAHMDHFCVRTLAQFERSTPVLFPAGDALIDRALGRLGFENRRGVTAGDEIDVGALVLRPTASSVEFPEMGMVFADGRSTFWNTVDTVISEATIGNVQAAVGTVDLLFAKYQPLIETALMVNALGSDFPFAKYEELLQAVWNIAPRAVAPGSCGYRYSRAPWLNDRGFPITERQFEADLRVGMPKLRVLHVPHGGTIDLDRDFEIEDRGLPHATRGEARLSTFDWRPDRGVPALADSAEPPREALRARVDAYLDGPFLAQLAEEPPHWLGKLARHEVTWRLEIHYGGGHEEVRLLDFHAPSVGWRAADETTFVKLHTSVTASAIIGLLDGTRNAYSLTFNDIRVVERLYGVHRDGLVHFGSVDDEPLMKILCKDADERFIDAQLDELSGPSPKPERTDP